MIVRVNGKHSKRRSMKANHSTRNRALTIVCSFAFIIIFLTSCHKNYQDGDLHTGVYALSGDASSSQMVPAVTAGSTGTIIGTYNTHNHVITWTAYWNNLTGSPTSASFHQGAAGSAGFTLEPTWTFYRPLAITDSVSGTMVLTADQANQLINGEFYYTIETTTNSTGEIRGQISAKVY